MSLNHQNHNKKIVTAIAYLSDINVTNYLGELITNKQDRTDYANNREININHNRHELQQKIKTRTDVDLVLLMDSDVIVSEEALTALVENFKGTPLCINTKNPSAKHIYCACCLLSFDDYVKIDYINTYIDSCQCTKIQNQIGNVKFLEGYAGYETGKKESYLSSSQHRLHIKTKS